MNSPLQEVPSTPSLSLYTAVLKRNANTPEAVVPDGFFDYIQDQSVSVPGTPVPAALPSSPRTPNAWSLTRSMSRQGRRYIYNPSLASRFVRNSPAGSKYLGEQVVPSTPVGGFALPCTPTSSQRRRTSPRMQVNTPNTVDNEVTIDAAGDRPLKRKKVENQRQTNSYINKTPTSRPRSQRREAVVRYRRSPEAVRESGDAAIFQDFLDLI
ncbi:uncharacterized protein LOC123544886 [Mercenaria mercenaria]|uniref:uncharacterized protein LOC123544886 n=1 Tax=Mercenaria mercenaria TaxID=6596 RepID=UPI00234ED9D1|nr:uncharacterized protein LOC123544886 [Mercenaria mercenaria]XP_045186920.2 uncharacterized protein LOC123544886 [Mercenaria mercenaria]